jgi:hypothetical protein
MQLNNNNLNKLHMIASMEALVELAASIVIAARLAASSRNKAR